MITMHANLHSLSAEPGVPDFRAEIRDRLKRLGKSRYWLSMQLPHIARSSIYEFLREKKPTEIGSDKLESILSALEKAERQKP